MYSADYLDLTMKGPNSSKASHQLVPATIPHQWRYLCSCVSPGTNKYDTTIANAL
jgi:hypothetical protein